MDQKGCVIAIYTKFSLDVENMADLGAEDKKAVYLVCFFFSGALPCVEFTVAIKEGAWCSLIEFSHHVEDSFTT